MRYYGGSIAQGYADALNQMQQRALQKQQMDAQKQAMAMQAFQLQQSQLQAQQQALAQKNAGQAFGDLVGSGQPPPQVPVQAMGGGGAPAPQSTPMAGPPAPPPGQASVPAMPPGPPPGAMPPGPPQVPMQAQRTPMPAQPPQPAPIKPYVAPSAPPPAGPPQVPLGQGAPAPQPPQQPGGISLDAIAKTLTAQGVKGQDLYQALMSAVPLMDAQSKTQMAMISQQFKQQQFQQQQEYQRGTLSERERHDRAMEGIGRDKAASTAAADQGLADTWTDDAIGQAAADMLLKGTLPSIGQGKAATGIRGKIEAERAKMGKELGLSPSEIAALPTAGKADAASLLQMTKRTDFVQQAEEAALNNGKMAQKLSEKVAGLGDIRAFNKMAIAGQTEFNNPEVAQYLTALDAFKKEYIRVMTSPTSNAMPTEGAQARANELISAAASPASLKAQLDILQFDMDNVLKSSRDQMQGIRERLSHPGKYYNAGGEPSSGARAPAVGIEENGYRFKGGDPSKQTSWEKI